MLEDTIAAIATAPGVGGIAIIRISGPSAEAIFHNLFQPRKPSTPVRSHHLYHGDIRSSETGAILDEVMVTLMHKPHSFTGEDVLEIHCHGGFLAPQKILAAVVKAGARPAEAGEFTRRAFLNGRLDLSQAEAIADLVAARTEKGLEVAISQLKGDLAQQIDGIIRDVTDILAHLEATIDFSEDMDDITPDADLAGLIHAKAQALKDLALTYDEGSIYRNGVSLVIAGRANVGKSSLLNRLLGEKRAIVTPTPGTTRDFIEESIDLQGLAMKITDTAGIRTTGDDIEQAGIDLVWERIETADAVLVLLDGSQPLTQEDRDVLIRCNTKPIIPVINKSDLPQRLSDADIMTETPKSPVRISAKFNLGMDSLKSTLYQHFMGRRDDSTRPATIITNLRHKLAIEKAGNFLFQAFAGASRGASPELMAADIRDALENLEEIGGKTLNDTILDRIFSTFCIGK